MLQEVLKKEENQGAKSLSMYSENNYYLYMELHQWERLNDLFNAVQHNDSLTPKDIADFKELQIFLKGQILTQKNYNG